MPLGSLRRQREARLLQEALKAGPDVKKQQEKEEKSIAVAKAERKRCEWSDHSFVMTDIYSYTKIDNYGYYSSYNYAYDRAIDTKIGGRLKCAKCGIEALTE